MEKMQKNAEWSFGLERWGKNQESVGEDLGKTSLIYKDGTRNWNIADPYPMDIISDSKAKKTYSDCNAVLQSGDFYRVTSYLGLQVANKINPEDVRGIVMRTKIKEVTYELIREE